ncbi:MULTISPECIES: Stk1 family PASTA domain-containing Ser/Thr kinase [unclassified Corynebacterium]|uniref:Stk1 family PASTA domain-containing Ser/Thr kinase n=1 Tax=unclassified Corynebacterium TaxID=2624378 RepID=UPI0008A58CBF|nr:MULTISPECIES: Stk1 family PASTA domain-containing Ser/Thr kinase [unclassified Corynebacterium]OFJ55870.1 serine/threonine protein kinase [Corynebacterium sp. HMSC076C10]OFK32710.1 serine/threonine protein kinase [Corynebacterium sp. HMSC064E08]
MSGNDDLLSGRYRLGELIGVGGMSDVYRAEDTVLGRSVAVKMMRADLARDENFLARFRREAKNSALLNHPSIVSVYDTGETDSPMGRVPFIVMELIQGETLRDLVRREGRLDPKKAASIMASVCDALTASHHAGIIHRDIKPANIMLTNTGKVKVMDFGIARALGDSTTMTQTAAVLGTAQYLSPEQARGKTADARSDIYAVGCVLFEAVTGAPPFTGETPLSVAYQHVQDQPPRPSGKLNTDPNTAQALDAVLLTAMAKDPMERYDSAEDFAQDLRRLARGEDPLALAHHGAHDDDAKTTEFLPATPSDAETRVTPAQQATPAAVPAPAPAPEPERVAAQPEAPAQIANTDEPEKKKGGAGKTVALAAAALVALGGVGYGAYQLFNSSTEVETVAIPQVEGLNVNEATQVLEQAGFVVNRVDEPNPDVPRDTVIATEPGVGSGLPQGSRIKLRVSSGPELTNVPDVRDKQAEEARRLLEEAGLVVNPKLQEEPSEDVPRGNVIEQSPAAGSQVSKGTRVTLTVSSGIETKTVPDVTGQRLDSARTTLESAGFVVEVVEVDSTEEQGTVVEVPQKGTELTVGTTVELHVSRGNQIKMPRVEGQTRSDAEKALTDAGFEGTIRTEEVTTLDLSKVDHVEKANPSAGSKLNKDGEVTLRVYRLGVAPESSSEERPAPEPPIRLPDLLPN